MIFNCCCPAIRCRMVIIGLDRPGKRRLYSKLTGEQDQMENIHVKHLERRIKYKGLHVYLCSLDESEQTRKLWWCNIRHADALIYVINTQDASNFDTSVQEFKHAIDQAPNVEKMNILVLCNNATEIKGKITELYATYKGYTNIKIAPCIIEDWKDVNPAMEWLAMRIKSEY